MTILADLFAAVRERPTDDTPREVFADALDDYADSVDNPESARAHSALIRVQLELANSPLKLPHRLDLLQQQKELLEVARASPWLAPAPLAGVFLGTEWEQLGAVSYAVVGRGFADEAHVPSRWFAGWVCQECNGAGAVIGGDQTAQGVASCPECEGQGRWEPVAAELFKQHPITRVVPIGLSGPTELDEESRSDLGTEEAELGEWYFGRYGLRAVCGRSGSGAPVWDVFSYPGGTVYSDEPDLKFFSTRRAASEWLSAACVRYGRQVAGLG